MAKKKEEIKAAEEVVEIKEEIKEEAVEEKAEKKGKKAKAEEEVKIPKKTKGEIAREIKAEVKADENNVTRTDRNRAEKAARREAKAARKNANYVEQKKSKMSNGVLAILIFGVLILMFVSVWGYNYFKKDASIESYLEANGGKEVYSSITLDENRTAKITADKNDMKVAITVKANKDDVKDQIKYYKSGNGADELEYIGAYFLNSIKPNVRGFSATATMTVKVNKKEAATKTIKYKDVKDILEKYGVTE